LGLIHRESDHVAHGLGEIPHRAERVAHPNQRLRQRRLPASGAIPEGYASFGIPSRGAAH
jgi:hypothetical protein